MSNKSITLKNLAGELIVISYDKEQETLWDFKIKIQNLLHLNDVWRINLFKNYEKVDEDAWYNKINYEDVIEYFISDDTCIKIEIKFNRILYTSSIGICGEYNIFLSIDEENYEYIFYSIDKGGNTVFVSNDNTSIHTNYSNNNNNSFLVLYIIDEDDIYDDTKSLFLNNKNVPIIFREKVAYNIFDKWNKEFKDGHNRIYDLIYNT